MNDKQTTSTQDNPKTKAKTWDEAIQELGSFILQTKAEEQAKQKETCDCAKCHCTTCK